MRKYARLLALCDDGGSHAIRETIEQHIDDRRLIDAELDPLPTGPAVPDLRLIRRRSTSGRTGRR